MLLTKKLPKTQALKRPLKYIWNGSTQNVRLISQRLLAVFEHCLLSSFHIKKPINSHNLSEERDIGGSSSPRSSIDESLSENVHVISNDFVSEGYNSQSR